ncbi:MAG TPA: hypothetical protein VGH20_06945 [Myxococcales bacterium]
MFALLVVAIYVLALPRGEAKPVTLNRDAWYAKATAVSPSELTDPGHCIANGVLRVKARQACALTVGSTWSIRRRALVLNRSTPGLSAHVSASDNHPERNVDADLTAEQKELPVDRGGARLQFVCGGMLDCQAIIVPP